MTTIRHQYSLNASEETTTGVDIGLGGTPTYVQAEDVDIQFTLYATTDHSSAVNVSNTSSIEWVLTDPSDWSEKVTKTKGSGVSIVSNGTGGKVKVTLSASDTSNLSPKTYRHQYTITDDGNSNQTVAARGDFELTSNFS